MTARRVRAVGVVRVVLALVVLTVMMGCNAVEPTSFTTIDDAKALSATRSELKEIFDKAAGSAMAAVDGGELRNGDSVNDLSCGEPYGKEFRELQVLGTFPVQGRTLDTVMEQVRSAWDDQGWTTKVTAEGKIFLETKTSTGVRVSGSATFRAGANNATKVGVGLNVGTGCLKLPKSAVESP